MRKILAAIMLMTTFTVWADDLIDGALAFQKKDYAKSLFHFKIAAAQNNVTAQNNIGFMYQHGYGVVQDYAEAVRWYKLASAQGHSFAQNSLANMYLNGEGVAQNFLQAHVWFNLAAAQGDKEAADSRNRVSKQMTPQQIAEAQKLARECLARNYKRCD